jgi:hypothetical protein
VKAENDASRRYREKLSRRATIHSLVYAIEFLVNMPLLLAFPRPPR